jgi:hypothetical protein
MKKLSEYEVSELLKFPIFPYIRSCHYGEEFQNPLIDEKDKVVNKEISKEQLVLYLDEFRRMYKSVKPYKLTHSHPLWGTVKMMDMIFHSFVALYHLDMYMPTFSNYWTTGPFSESRDAPDFDINWEAMYSDISHVTDRINLTLGCMALDNPEYFRIANREYLFQRMVAYALNYRSPGWNYDGRGQVSKEDITYEQVIIDGKKYSMFDARNMVHFYS